MTPQEEIALLRSLLQLMTDSLYGVSQDGRPLTDAPLEVAAREALAGQSDAVRARQIEAMRRRRTDPDREACRRAEECQR